MKHAGYISLALLLVILPSVFASFPEDLPWRYPARWRLIYKIDTSPLTSDKNVWVDISIDPSYYTNLVNWLKDLEWCPGDYWTDDRQFWPHPWYVSTDNNNHRFVDDYMATGIREYQITNSCTLRLPTSIRVKLSDMDGTEATFKDHDHYIIIYLPALHLSYWWEGLGDPEPDSLTPGCLTFGREYLPLDLNDGDFVLAYVDAEEGADDSISVWIHDEEDERHWYLPVDISGRTVLWRNLAPEMTRKSLRPLSDLEFSEFDWESVYVYDIILLYPALISLG